MHDKRAAPLLSAPSDSGLAAPKLEARNVVVEFLGVSGSGKSTLARSLAARFAQQGYCTRLLTMQRPTVSKRLVGVLSKLGNMLKFALSNRCGFSEVRFLLRLFPQKNLLHSVRALQYVLYLFSVSANVIGRYQVTILDQGFIQALYSLALFSKTCENSGFASALHVLPKPDILITLDISAETIDRRLTERRGLAKVARVAPKDHETIDRSLNLVMRIESILREGRCRVIHYSPGHAVSIEQSTDDLFHAVWPIVSGAAPAGATAPSIAPKEDARHGSIAMHAPHDRETAASLRTSRSTREERHRRGAAVQLLWRPRPPL